MKLRILATLLFSAASVASATQSTDGPAEPLARADVPRRTAPEETPSWPSERRDGYLLDAPIHVSPSPLVPAVGIGLPPGTSPREEDPAQMPHLARPLTRPAGAPLRSEGPFLDDLAGKTPSKPVMQGFDGPGHNTFPYACTDMAVGPDHIMTVMYHRVTVYDRCGTELFSENIHTFLGLDPSLYPVGSPRILFDPWDDRWVMLWHVGHYDEDVSVLSITVSADETPIGMGTWWTYNLNAVQVHNGKLAYATGFEVGFSNDYVTLGGDMWEFKNGFLWARLLMFRKSEVYSGSNAAVLSFSDLYNPNGSKTDDPRAARMQTSWQEGGENVDGVWINARSSGGDKLTLWKITDAFGANNLSKVDLDVNAYAYPPDAVQPNGTTFQLRDCKITRAVVTRDLLGSNGIELFTSLTAERNGTSGAVLYKLDPVTPSVEYQANFGAPGLYYFFPSPVADYSGSAAWVFARTGPTAGNEPEMRFIDYDRGTLGISSTQVRDGDGSWNYTSWGSYFGGSLDWGDYMANFSVPGRPAKMWMKAQYGKPDDWGTYLGATSVFTQGDLASVTPTSKYSISGPAGGPFTPSSRQYTLTNTGEVGLAYQVQDLPSWLIATPATGEAYPGDTYVTLQVHASANSLPPGVYTQDVRFQDCFNGGNDYLRTVELTVTGSGTAYCFCSKGNPSGNVPPCKNFNDGTTPPGGCRHDESTAGARLDVSGKASLSKDTLVLLGTRGPKSNSTLFFQANNNLDGPPHNHLGDGMRCAGGGLVRLQVRMTSSGAAQTTKSISARSASLGHPISPGETLYYQWWIRDPGGSPCGQESNTSNGYMITWGP